MNKVLKRVVVVWVFIITAILMSNAQDVYQVAIQKKLNVRSEPNSQSEIIAQLEPSQTFLVYGNDGSWAQIYIYGQPGYVYSNYITYLGPYEEASQEDVRSEKSDTFLDILPDFEEYKDEAKSKTFFYSSIVLLVISLILVLLIINDIIIDNLDIWLSITAVLFAGCSIIEFVYIIFAPDPLWFCFPSIVGWIWTIVNFILFAVFVAAQCFTFVFILRLIESRGGYDSCLPISMIGVPIVIVVFILFTMFWKDSIDVVFYIGGALLLLQLAIILYKSFREECMGVGLLMSLFYLIGLIGTVMVLMAFIVLFVVAAIVVIAICIGLMMLAGGGSGRGSRKMELTNEYGQHVTYIDSSGYGDDGNRYRKGSDGRWIKD